MLIQGNRITRWAGCIAAVVCAVASMCGDSWAVAADESGVEPTAAAGDSDGADVSAEAEADHSAPSDGGGVQADGPAEDGQDGGHAAVPGGHGEDAGHTDGAHHDPYDLSHANATPKLEDPSEWRYDMALCTFAVFLVLLLLLRAFAWRPIMAGLERRESAIATRIEEAERDAAEAANQLQAYRDKLATAAQEAQEIVTQARRDAEAVADKVRNAAAEDAVRERQRALADIESAKKVALHEIAEKGADMAVGLAGRIVHRELDSQDHAELIRETLGQFPSSN